MLTYRQWYGWAGSECGNTEGVLENAVAENRSERRAEPPTLPTKREASGNFGKTYSNTYTSPLTLVMLSSGNAH